MHLFYYHDKLIYVTGELLHLTRNRINVCIMRKVHKDKWCLLRYYMLIIRMKNIIIVLRGG